MPFPAFLAGLGSFLGSTAGQTAISIGQGIGGVFQAKRARDRQDSQIQRIVADAKAAGIHPLAALGSPVASAYGTPVTGSATGDAINGLRSSADNRTRRLSEELLEAQIGTERAKEAALLQEARSRTMIRQGGSAAMGGPIPLYVDYVDDDGNILRGPNPDLPSNDQFPAPAFIHGNDYVVEGPFDSPLRMPGNVVPPDPREKRYPLPPKRPKSRPLKKPPRSRNGASGYW